MKLRLLVLALAVPGLLSAAAFGQKQDGGSASAYLPVKIKPGVVVEISEINKAAAEISGLKDGDVLLRWSQGSRSGKLESPFDVWTLQQEAMNLGAVELEGLRRNKARKWTATNLVCCIPTRPNFTGAVLSRYEEGRKLYQANRLAEATAVWKNLAEKIPSSASPWLGAWLRYTAGENLVLTPQWQEGNALYQGVLDDPSWHWPPKLKILFLISIAFNFSYHSDFPHAIDYAQAALIESDQLPNDAEYRGLCLYQLATWAFATGDFSKTETAFAEGLEVERKAAPIGLMTATYLTHMGVFSEDKGDLTQAEQYVREALKIYGIVAPLSVYHSQALSLLGAIAYCRGNLTSAEEYYLRAFRIQRRLGTYGRESSVWTLQNLGNIAYARHNLTDAEQYCLSAAKTQKELHYVDDGFHAMTLNSLGHIEKDRHNFAKAQEYYVQGIALMQKGSRFALAIVLSGLGDVYLEDGNLAKAEENYRQALQIQEQLVPGSAEYAQTLMSLAYVSNQKRDFDAADEFYAKAIDVLEHHTAHLGGSSRARAGFRARHEDYYLQYARLLIAQKKPAEAFSVIERFRARTFLETLTEGHVDIRKGVDPALLEKERSLRQLSDIRSNARLQPPDEANQIQNPQALDKEITDLQARYQEVEDQIRASSPAYASLTQPSPVTADEVQKELLDDNTVLLEYALADDHSYVFAITADSVDCYELPARSEIESAAARFYLLLTAQNQLHPGESAVQKQARVATRQIQIREAAAALSHMILEPVAEKLGKKRLLIVSDDVLQYIPFTALPAPQTQKSAPQTALLLASHEIVNLPSASVLAQLRREEKNRKAPAQAVAVLADPVFSAEDSRLGASLGHDHSWNRSAHRSSLNKPLTRSIQDVGLRSMRGEFLPRLVFSRSEAENILSAAPSGLGMEAVDFDANRDMATSSRLSQYRIVHFATHSLLDNRHPELSGLVFSLVDKNGKPQNGFLSLQDIYNLNLPVDMVVLSACQTALGEDIHGEGLEGLTRGFMYAGASRVVASLWKVDDAATADLMARFYTAMFKDGLSPTAALRKAQIEMSQQKRWADPYFWAGFELQGEWKAAQ